MSEAKRVVFDLDGTLISSNPERKIIALRPGAEGLLRQLRDSGLDLILWTVGSRREVDIILSQFPGLRANFSQVITADDMEKYLEPLRQEAARLNKNSPQTRCLENLSYGLGGGKYPPAVKARHLIDDSDDAAYTAKVLGTFEHIFPNSIESDESPDEWAKRVAQALLGK